MIRLVRAELSRMAHRRMTWVIGVVALAFCALLTYGAHSSATPAPAAQQAAAEQAFQEAYNGWRSTCPGAADAPPTPAATPAPRQTRPSSDATPPPGSCLDNPPRREHFGRAPASLGSVWDSLSGGGLFFGVLALVLGASYIAAEHATGSMTNWLTFEPRRTRVFVAKVAAAFLGSVIGGAVVTGALVLVARVILVSVGAAGPSAAEFGEVAGGACRLGAFIVLAHVGGTAGGFLVRHTAGVLGTLLGFAVLEQIVGGMLHLSPRWLLADNVLAFLRNGYTVHTYECQGDPPGPGSCGPLTVWISFEHGAAVLGVTTLVALLAAYVVFRRRDVA